MLQNIGFQNRGFTLQELIYTITVGVILAAVSAPSLTTFLTKQKADAIAHQTLTLLNTARYAAVTSGRRVTLCGLSQTNDCTLDDIHSVVIFEDANYNQTVEDTEEVYARIDLLYAGTIHVSASLQAHHFTFNSDGSARQFGSITFCPPVANQHQLVRRVSVTRMGRAYMNRDLDGDGYLDGYGGVRIRCT